MLTNLTERKEKKEITTIGIKKLIGQWNISKINNTSNSDKAKYGPSNEGRSHYSVAIDLARQAC